MKKILSLSLCAIALFICLTCAVTNVRAETTKPTAEYASTDTTTGSEWEKRYGYAGYIIAAADELNPQSGVYRTFYSDLYKNKGNDGKTPIFPEFANDGNVSKDGTVYYDYEDKDYGLDDTAPISKWGITTGQWGMKEQEPNPDSPYIPETTTPSSPAISYGGGSTRRGSSVFFTLSSDEEIYVTVFIRDYDSVGGEEIDIYNSEVTANNNTIDKSFFGNPLTDTVFVRNNGQKPFYVTYKIKGAGCYQIVATKGEGNTIGIPSIFALFFDKQTKTEADFVRYDTVSGNDWQQSYGKDGYVILAGDAQNTQYPEYNRNFYSDMYEDYDGVTPISAQTENELVSRNGTIYTDYATKNYGLKDAAPVKKWGITTSMWQNEAGGNAFAPYVPNSNEKSQVCIVGGYSGTAMGNTLFFTLSDYEEIYVTLYVYNYWVKDFRKPVYIDLYNSQVVKESQTATAGVFGEPITKTVSVVPDGESGIAYVTYRIKGAGRYQFVTSREEGTDGRTVIAAFFFDKTLPDAGRETRSVFYELNGGENSVYNLSKVEKGTRNNVLPAKKELHDFIGWFADPEFNEEVKEISFFDDSEPLTLYAKFEPWKVFSINYELNGGENSADNPTRFYQNIGVKELAEASKTHYYFKGWYTDENFTVKAESISASTDYDVTLYAKFEERPKSKIEYVLDGGENSELNPVFVYEGEFALPLYPAKKDGAKFIGWFFDENFMNEALSVGYGVDGDLKVYAAFAEEDKVYTVKYVLNGGENSPNNPSIYVAGKSYVLSDAVKNGFEFIGWYSDEEMLNKKSVIAETDEGNLTFYAAYEKVSVTRSIVYFLDGGEQSEQNGYSYTEGQTVALYDAKKEGYEFQGWYTDAAFTERITEISAESRGDLRLFAKFVKSEANKNGCGGAISVSVVGETAMLAAGIVILIIKRKHEKQRRNRIKQTR